MEDGMWNQKMGKNRNHVEIGIIEPELRVFSGDEGWNLKL